jgi:hypothetical protein
MPLKGYLEAVEPFQVRGWVYDDTQPDRPLTVEILLNDQVIGSVEANLYRADLEKAQIGAGNHAFIYNLERRHEPAELEQIAVRVPRDDGTHERLPAIGPAENAPPPTPAHPILTFEGLTTDPQQYPVFILGAARSGTSAMAQALLKLGRYQGNQEGHLLDILAYLSVATNRFYATKADELAPGRDTTIARLSPDYFQSALDELCIRTIKAVFPDGSWVDKTPNSNMIHLAPRFLRIWPNSRFVFMKRRFLENAASRAVKFPEYDFSRNCREWSEVMTAWQSVKSQLQGAAIEVDQNFLKDRPNDVARALRNLLRLTSVEETHLAQAFKYDFPERTSAARPAHLSLTDMGWDDQRTKDFQELCAPVMETYGYSTSSDYYLPGRESAGLVWI